MNSANPPRVPAMGRLAKLKAWLTVPDAARYLSLTFGEDVSEADVLRLGLDGHLRLSVRFVNGATAKRYRQRSPEERLAAVAEIERAFELRRKAIADGLPPPPPRTPTAEELEERIVFPIDDNQVFDLPFVGGERITVESMYQRLTGGPAVELSDLMGTFFDGPDGQHYQLQERFDPPNCAPRSKYYDDRNFYPPGELPESCMLVVRTSALKELEGRLNGTKDLQDASVRPLQQRERTTLLAIIAALAKAAKIDIGRTSKAALAIAALTETEGARVSARAIEEHLKRVPDALARLSE